MCECVQLVCAASIEKLELISTAVGINLLACLPRTETNTRAPYLAKICNNWSSCAVQMQMCCFYSRRSNQPDLLSLLGSVGQILMIKMALVRSL